MGSAKSPADANSSKRTFIIGGDDLVHLLGKTTQAKVCRLRELFALVSVLSLDRLGARALSHFSMSSRLSNTDTGIKNLSPDHLYGHPPSQDAM
jgi:hypothetical protein